MPFANLAPYQPAGIVPRTPMGAVLHRITRAMLAFGPTPKMLTSKLILLMKEGGDPSSPHDRRGISLMNSVVKVMATHANTRLTDELDDTIIPDQQGFRTNGSCVKQVITLWEACHQRQHHGLITSLMFYDFKKAFDRVPHDMLLAKLERLCVSGNLLNLLASLNTGASVRIRHQNPHPLRRATGQPSFTRQLHHLHQRHLRVPGRPDEASHLRLQRARS